MRSDNFLHRQTLCDYGRALALSKRSRAQIDEKLRRAEQVEGLFIIMFIAICILRDSISPRLKRHVLLIFIIVLFAAIFIDLPLEFVVPCDVILLIESNKFSWITYNLRSYPDVAVLNVLHSN